MADLESWRVSILVICDQYVLEYLNFRQSI